MKIITAECRKKNKEQDIPMLNREDPLRFPCHHQSAESYEEIAIDKAPEKYPGRQ